MATIRKVTIKADLAWQASQSLTSKRWIGVCDELNLAMEAESLDELYTLIPETMHLLMVDLLVDNELERYLRDKGWQAQNMPSSPNERDVEFDVPWQLIAEGARGTERRAS